MDNMKKKIQNVRGLIDTVTLSKSEKKKNDIIVNKNNKFFDTYNDLLKHLVTSYKYAHNYFHFNISEEQCMRLTSIMNDAKICFEERTVVISTDQFHRNVDKINKEISESWIKFITEYNQEIEENLSILLQIREDKRTITELKRKISACIKWPLHEEDCVAYKSARETVNELFTCIKLDYEIVDFLKKISEKNATLNDLTPTIQEWIKAENMAEKIFLWIKFQ